MTRTKEPDTYANRVWKGDSSTIAEAEEKYRKDPSGQLIPLAMVLYSFRANYENALKLLALGPELQEFAEEYIKNWIIRSVPSKVADTSDVLSTYLEWMGNRKELSFAERKRASDLALKVARYGVIFAERDRANCCHSRCFLYLTIATLLIRSGNRGYAEYYLDQVGLFSQDIRDPNQRARAYRKLGFVLKKSGRFFDSLIWSLKACFVPEIPVAVRLKSIAALLGIES